MKINNDTIFFICKRNFGLCCIFYYNIFIENINIEYQDFKMPFIWHKGKVLELEDWDTYDFSKFSTTTGNSGVTTPDSDDDKAPIESPAASNKPASKPTNSNKKPSDNKDTESETTEAPIENTEAVESTEAKDDKKEPSETNSEKPSTP